MKTSSIIMLVVFVLIVGFIVRQKGNNISLPKGDTVLLEEDRQVEDTLAPDSIDDVDVVVVVEDIPDAENLISNMEKKPAPVVKEKKVVGKKPVIKKPTRDIFVTDGVKHSIPLEEIRRGCPGRDCIPSVDSPEFVSVTEANDILPEDTVGIGLVYKGETRFYPFNMLVTREIVNDVVADDPLVVTYCPLCGTGIVFERQIDGRVFEFGVSGMLWQSNLLMYNREDDEDKISLWSQVLGESVLGVDTGTKLSIVRSDIVRYADWRVSNPTSRVLNTGRIGDPYGGDYYRVASSFGPSFDEVSSPLEPTVYVLGVEINGKHKAYVKDSLKNGITKDEFNGVSVLIEKDKTGKVDIIDSTTGEDISIVEGFWFSWVSAHPDTELLK